MAKKKKIKEPPFITLKGRKGNDIILINKNLKEKEVLLIKEILNLNN